MLAFIHRRALLNGVIGASILGALVLVGSRRLLYFDAALMPYLLASIFAVIGVIYHYTVWLDRPPTRMLWKRSLQMIMSPRFFHNLSIVGKSFGNQIVLQKFVRQRSFYRWFMHFSLAWGTLIAWAITFPLVFGWIHFQTAAGSNDLYQMVVFGFPSIIFHPHGAIGWLFFNTLNVAAVFVIIGTVMAFTRRILFPESSVAQNFMNDFLPLLILFSVAVTGLFLTYSSHLMGGAHFQVLSTVHAFTVVAFLIYLPFGKFFHIFQRFAQMGASLYIHEKGHGEQAKCPNCGVKVTSLIQMDDVKKVLGELGFQYEVEGKKFTVQNLCPLCRRRMFMWKQDEKLQGEFDTVREKIRG